jgi:tRNA (cytidine/uridine-2'-O-)-methyltransferase
MFDIILFSPQIPPNTGNVIRLSANCGARLHLVRPLGFALDAKSCRRAGLDYHALSDVLVHDDLDSCLTHLDASRLFAITTKGKSALFDTAFRPGDAFLFGSETAGLPDFVHARFDDAHRLRLPMIAGNRSLNLANAVSIVMYEAWRQIGFVGAASGPS